MNLQPLLIPNATIHKYKRYLPTAFDESLSLLEKVNKIIEFLNTVINVTNDTTLEFDKLERETNDKIQNLVNQFTDLRDWLEGEGLEESTSNVLDEWFQNGKLETIINENVFNMKADKSEVDAISSQLAQTVHKGEGGVITPAMLSQETKEQMTGGSVAVVGKDTVLEENIVNRQVTPIKTTFVKAGKNKFLGGYENAHFTGASPFTFVDSTGKTAILKLEPNKTYTVTKSNDTDRFRIALSSVYPVNDTVVTTNSTLINDGTTPKTVTTTDTEFYLLVYVSSTSESKEPSWLQVEEGGIATEYSDAFVINLDEKSIPTIKPEKTSFIEQSSKNLFNGDYYDKTYIVSTSGVILQSEGAHRTTKRIPIVAGKYYTISGSDRNVFRFEDKDNNLLSYVNEVTALAPANARYMMVYYTQDGTAEKVQIEEGQAATNYEHPYRLISEINTKPPIKEMEFFEQGKNLFNGEFVNATISGSSSTGFIFNEVSNGKSAVIKLEPNTKYTISKSQDTNRFRWVLYNEYPVNGSSSKNGIDIYDSVVPKTITTNDTEIYLVVYVSNQSEIPEWLQVEKGVVATPYKAPYRIKEEYLGKEKPNFFIVGDSGDNYTSSSETITVSSLGNDVNNLYGIYDSLVAAFPDYVTKTLVATESTGLPIYRYDFKPNKPKGTMTVNFPKLLYISGTHGMEKSAMVDGVRFFVDLARNWQTNKVLQVLRANVHFVVIPSLNPYGFNHNQRTNANGVDLNRNFPNGWVSDYPNEDRYPGTEPLTEIESQLVDDLLNEGFAYAIDHHNYNSYPTGADDIFYMFSQNDDVLRVLIGLSNYLDMKAKSDYPYLPQDNNHLIRLIKQPPAGRITDYFDTKEVAGSILEAVISIGGTEADMHQLGADGVGNLMLSVVRNLENIRS